MNLTMLGGVSIVLVSMMIDGIAPGSWPYATPASTMDSMRFCQFDNVALKIKDPRRCPLR